MKFDSNPRPFLRWAGGKNWLVKNIKSYLPPHFENYYEPFLGGGSVFIYLKSNDLIKKHAILSDINYELINSYEVIKNHVEELVQSLLIHDNNKDYYYSIREIFHDDIIQKASRFIYLNRTSYNGIYRENLKGQYNVPYGHKKYNQLFDLENLKSLNTLFNGCRFENRDFESLLPEIKRNDLVFIDPPYTVAHGLNGFIKYNQKIFSWADQLRLKNFLMEINEKGAFYIMTNAYHESILDLFANMGNVYLQSRPSLVGGKGAIRTVYKEILITNI